MKICDRDYDYIDFETKNECWNVYDLEDGTILKVKVVLIKVIPRVDNNAPGVALNTANLMAVLSKKGTRRAPSVQPPVQPPNAMKIEKQDISFNTISEEWNEYILEDGKIIKIKPGLLQIDKSENYDQFGEPIYLMRTQPLIKIL